MPERDPRHPPHIDTLRTTAHTDANLEQIHKISKTTRGFASQKLCLRRAEEGSDEPDAVCAEPRSGERGKSQRCLHEEAGVHSEGMPRRGKDGIDS